MGSVEWVATIVGAVFCLIYSWFLCVTARFHSRGVQFNRISQIVGMIGTLVLAGMAFVGPPYVSKQKGVETMRTLEGYDKTPSRYEVLLNIAQRTFNQLGKRPSKDHVAYEHSDGRLEWVTSDTYRKLLKTKKDN